MKMKKLLIITMIAMLTIVFLVSCGNDEPVVESTPVPVETVTEQPVELIETEPVNEQPVEEEISLMPDVIGERFETIEVHLKNMRLDFLDLTIEIEYLEHNSAEAGRVFETIPPPGEQLKPNDIIIFMVSRGPPRPIDRGTFIELVDNTIIDFEVTEDVFWEYWEDFIDEVTIIENKYLKNEIDEDEHNLQLKQISEGSFVFVSAVFKKLWAEWNGSAESIQHYILNPASESLKSTTESPYFYQFFETWGRRR